MNATWIQRANAWLNTDEDGEERTPNRALAAAVVGPNGSGKSSILRRLAIDKGVSPPAWLSVSAREETHSANSLELHGLELIDTPGLGALSTEHGLITRDAVEQADAIILVLLPQLIGDTPELREILTGEVFHPDGWDWPPGAVVYVISKFDEAGVDPLDDLQAFQDLAERKCLELEELALREGLPPPDGIHVVAPDPYALVGDATDATAADYDPGRGWDGIDVLQAALERLSSRTDELRSESIIRQRLAQLTRSVESIEEAKTKLERDCAALAIDVATWRQHSDDADVLDHTARQSLENDLRAAISGMRTTELSHDFVEQRLSEAIQSWSDHVEAGRARLGSQLKIDVKTLRVDTSLPSWTQPSRQNLVDEHRSKIQRLTTGLRSALAAWHSSESTDTADAAVNVTRQWVEKSQRLLNRDVVGGVLEVASVLGELHADAAYQEQVNAVRERIREDVEAIASRILEGPWADVVGELRAAIADTLGPLQALHDEMLEQLRVTQSGLDDARELLESAPVVVGSSEAERTESPPGT